MSENKQTIDRYMEAFSRSDHSTILSCLTEDVEWVMPGAFDLSGKAEFDREIENDAFAGSPQITVTRMVEEGDVVVAEGRVQSFWKDGGRFHAVFCDVFEMRDSRIRRLISYVMEISDGLGAPSARGETRT